MNLIANASVVIGAPVEKVWDALVNPATIKQYMFGTNVVSNWEEGSPIVCTSVLCRGSQIRQKTTTPSLLS